MERLALPNVTLCAATSVNLAATLTALRRCLDQCEFGAALLFTDQPVPDPPVGLEVIAIDRLASARAYSRFVLADLPPYITTSHCLIVQWDGFILRRAAWDRGFLSFDYIGAPWPQFDDDHTVGNGGFSLRSKRLMGACRTIAAAEDHPEDVAIGRTHRTRLERDFDLRFADPDTAARFSYERTASSGGEFGFHGAFNLPAELGPDGWWDIYCGLDCRGALVPDFWSLLRSALRQPKGVRRACRMLWDRYG
jgi:Protein of unknown function (DUF5672)